MRNETGKRRRPQTRAGFSLAELTYVLALLLLIAAVVLPAWVFVQRWQRLTMARGDLKSIATSIRAYHARYNLWPGRAAAHTQISGDIHYGKKPSNAEVLAILRAAEGPSNPNHAANTNRIVFLELAAAAPGLSGLNTTGEFLDPWGTPYHIVLDLDYDNLCNVPDTIYQRIQGEGLIAWSCGPDRKSDTDDDLRSWKWNLPRRIALPGGF